MKTEKQKSKCMRDYLMAGAHKSKVRVLKTGKKMKELLPDAGIFMNHGAYDEKDWANLGFGQKLYAELVRTKSEYDPDNIIRYHHAPRSDGKNAVGASVVSVKDDNGWRALVRETGATHAQDTWKKVDELEAGLTWMKLPLSSLLSPSSIPASRICRNLAASAAGLHSSFAFR